MKDSNSGKMEEPHLKHTLAWCKVLPRESDLNLVSLAEKDPAHRKQAVDLHHVRFDNKARKYVQKQLPSELDLNLVSVAEEDLMMDTGEDFEIW